MYVGDLEINTINDNEDEMYYMGKLLLKDECKLINSSKFKLLLDAEDLDEKNAYEKYYEINRRAYGLRLCCEYFLKYILISLKIIDNPNISLGSIWKNDELKSTENDKKIMIHTILDLFNKIDEYIPNFTNNAFLVMACLEKNKMTYGSNSDILRNLLNQFYVKDGLPFQNDLLQKYANEYSNIFVESKYAMQRNKKNLLYELIELTNNLSFLADIYKVSSSKTNIDYGLAYIKAVLLKDEVYNSVLEIRSKEEIEYICDSEIINSNDKLMSLLLIEKIDINSVKYLIHSGYDSKSIYEKIIKKKLLVYSKYLDSNFNFYEDEKYSEQFQKLPKN